MDDDDTRLLKQVAEMVFHKVQLEPEWEAGEHVPTVLKWRVGGRVVCLGIMNHLFMIDLDDGLGLRSLSDGQPKRASGDTINETADGVVDRLTILTE